MWRLVAVVGVLAVGCGGGPPGEGALIDAVHGYSDAFLGGDGPTAFGLLSARCQERIGEKRMTAIVDAAAIAWGDASMGPVTVDELGETRALVSYEYDMGGLDQTEEPWVVEDGGWRQDDCDGIDPEP